MSRAYKFRNPEGLYFISFATVGWIDVFTRRKYKVDYIHDTKSTSHQCQGNGRSMFLSGDLLVIIINLSSDAIAA